MMNLATKQRPNILTPERVISNSLFFVPGLLLWTPNFSVAIAIFLVIYATVYCIQNRKNISLTKLDKLIFVFLSAYFLVNVPNVILDLGNFRYIDGPSKILLCIPVYLLFKQELPNISVKKHLEYGLVVGAIGAMMIALIQHFFLGYTRVDGFLFSINFGYLACSLAFLNLSFAFNSPRKQILFLGFFAASVATLLTLTRGAIFAIPLLLILIPAIYKMKLAPVKLATMVFAVVATLMSAYHLSPSVKERTDFTIQEFREVASGDIKDSASTGGRLQLWYASIEALKANPIYGLSHGDRETLNQHLYQKGKVSYWVTGVSRGHAHSQYFEMLASNGLFSIPAVFAMLVFPLLFFIRKRESEYARAGAIFVAGITIFGLTEVLLQANLISVYFGIFMAFFFAATLYGTKDNEQNALS